MGPLALALVAARCALAHNIYSHPAWDATTPFTLVAAPAAREIDAQATPV